VFCFGISSNAQAMEKIS